MKFSILSSAAFLASFAYANANANANPQVLTETAKAQVVTDVQNVYVTVTAGSEPSSSSQVVASSASDGPVIETVYVQMVAVVDQYGSVVSVVSSGTAPSSLIPSSTPSDTVVASSAPISSLSHSHNPHSSSTSSLVIYQTSTVSTSTPVAAPSSSSSSSSTSTPVPSSTTLAVSTVAPSSTSTPVVTPTPSSTKAASTSSAAPSSTAASSSSSNLDSFAQSCLNTHNQYRSLHSAGNLVWNSTLASFAQSYLAQKNCVFEHSGGPYGENLAMGYPSASDAITAWYDEIDAYNFGNGGFSSGTGHFTQVVWKGTQQLGCYSASCGSSGNYLVCEYYPAGNVIGQFAQNVLSN